MSFHQQHHVSPSCRRPCNWRWAGGRWSGGVPNSPSMPSGSVAGSSCSLGHYCTLKDQKSKIKEQHKKKERTKKHYKEKKQNSDTIHHVNAAGWKRKTVVGRTAWPHVFVSVGASGQNASWPFNKPRYYRLLLPWLKSQCPLERRLKMIDSTVSQ